MVRHGTVGSKFTLGLRTFKQTHIVGKWTKFKTWTVSQRIVLGPIEKGSLEFLKEGGTATI